MAALRAQGVRISIVDDGAAHAPGILSTHPSIIEFHHKLGVREADLVRHVGAAYKYGLAFSNWTGENDTRVCTYSPSGQMIDRIEFHHYLTRLRETRPDTTMEAFSLAACASRAVRFSHPEPNTPFSQLDYAMQFDRIGYLRFLRAYATDHGVHRIVAKVRTVDLDKETGDIQALVLDDGQTLSADFYFDSSGDAAILIEGQLASGFDSWQALFPCDRRIEIAHRSVAPTPLVNTITQERHGWCQSSAIPGATYRVHSFCSAIDTEDEVRSFVEALQFWQEAASDSGSLEILSQHPGVRREFWKHNCVAIGESAGFVEQLFIDSFHQTYTAIERWLELFPAQVVSPYLRRQYNLATREEYERIRDIHALPLMCAQKMASPFWQGLKSTAEWPDSLTHRVGLFRKTGKRAFYEADPVGPHQWIQWMTNFGIWPERYDPLIAEMSAKELEQRMENVERNVRALVSRMPKHDDLLLAIRHPDALQGR